jgi:hypothetical protein
MPPSGYYLGKLQTSLFLIRRQKYIHQFLSLLYATSSLVNITKSSRFSHLNPQQISYTAQQQNQANDRPPQNSHHINSISTSKMPPSTSASAGPQPKDMSQDAWLKQGGWTSMKHFLESYNLKLWEDDDDQEGQAIIRAMRQQEQEDWEEEQREKEAQKEKGKGKK